MLAMMPPGPTSCWQSRKVAGTPAASIAASTPRQPVNPLQRLGREAAAKLPNSIVAKAQRSPAAKRKETTGLTEDGLPVHSFHSLLADLATYSRIQVATALNENYVFTVYSRPTLTQTRTFELLGVKPDRTQ